jgi:hypothetical protein
MRIQVFDPPLCCPTGVCGPAVDPELARIGADLAWLAARGVTVERFNLAQQPLAFVGNARVSAILRETGETALPLVLCDEVVLAVGRYPTRDALAEAAGLAAGANEAEPTATIRGLRVACEPGSRCCS